MKMAHITINSAHFDESVAFYQSIVGLKITNQINMPGMRITFLANAEGETEIEIIEDPEHLFKGCGITIGFEVQDAAGYKAELEQKGYVATDIIRPNPVTAFFFVEDPNGVQVQFMENTKVTSVQANVWINRLGLEQHPEGGWFKECYQAPEAYGTSDDGRVMGGTIYFLLANEEISHFHVIDCEEIWYYHEGCGVRIWCLSEDGQVSYHDLGLGEGCEPMVVIPKGVIFGASNLDPQSYTLMSCATMPNFHYEGFRLVDKTELEGKYPAELVEKYCLQ